MLLRLHVKCNPYIINVRDDIKDAASSEADYKSASYIFNVRGWEAGRFIRFAMLSPASLPFQWGCVSELKPKFPEY
jgi:hypothetical protein